MSRTAPTFPRPVRRSAAPAAHDVVPPTLRRFLLGLLVLGMIGACVELFLLEHTEFWQQFIPFVTIALGFIATAAAALRPGRRVLLAFRAVMLLFVAVGITGIVLHYRGNVAFELEMYPSMVGRELIWKSLRGATPVGAPGFLAQLGLLGLACTYRHPRLARVSGRELNPEES